MTEDAETAIDMDIKRTGTDVEIDVDEPLPSTDGTATAAANSDGNGNNGKGGTTFHKKEVPWGSIVRNDDGNDDTVIQTIANMKDACYFLMPDWQARLSKFWILLTLACIIATAGVVGNSTATVIGAMIVAPLMMPIQGLMVSTVLLNKREWAFSLFMVVAGVGTSIAIGAIFGVIMNDNLFTKENNSQVSSRINPALTDLLAALATGTVGAISLVRSDIAGALPGVSISISLVPPLIVVGLMLSIQDWTSAVGAMLLFTTNFLCIMVMGIFTMYMYRIHLRSKHKSARLSRVAFFVCFIALAIVAVPLYFTSERLSTEADAKQCLEDIINPAVQEFGWRTRVVVTQANNNGSELSATVTIVGPPPFPDNLNGTSVPIAEKCKTVTAMEIIFLPAQFVEL